MKMKVKVAMLPTEKESDLWSHKGRRLYYQQANFNDKDDEIRYFVYFLSDEKVRNGDIYYSGLAVQPCTSDYMAEGINKPDNGMYKVVAASDESLKEILVYDNIDEKLKNDNFDLENPDSKKSVIPQIPESFMEIYADSNGKISEVMIEFDTGINWNPNNDGSESAEQIVKVRTRDDNTVIVHKVKKTEAEVELETMHIVMHQSEKETPLAYSEEDHNHVILPCPEAELCDMQQLEASTYNYQGLCLISDEPYKEGDWIYYTHYDPKYDHSGIMQKTKVALNNPHLWKKIVATSLSISEPSKEFKNVKYPIDLESIPEDFIKAFAKSNGEIKMVQVEVISNGEWEFERSSGYAGYRCQKCQTWVYSDKPKKCNCGRKVKTREDGTVIIHRIKNQMIPRDKVENMVRYAYNLGSTLGSMEKEHEELDVDKLIDQNL